MRIKLTLQFIGTDFSGWQLQNNARTVQGELEKAIFALYGEKCRVTGVGRTDEGVHARRYVAHYDVDKTMPERKIVLGLNRFLPQDLSVLSAQKAGEDFDARRSAVSKTYVYRMYVSQARQAMKDVNHLQLYKAPDIDLLRAGAALFVGEHDFAAFAKVGGNVKTTVRKIFSVEVKTSGDEIELFICGNAFLYNMVRNIVGCLLFLTQGKLTLDDVATMINTGVRTKHFKTVTGRALEMFDVQY